MSEMVERLAWNMARSFGHVVSIDECRFVTRQLLQEISEPTEEMLVAGMTESIRARGAEPVWRAMIEAALKE